MAAEGSSAGGSNTSRLLIQAVLAVVIVVLAYVLYTSVTAPWKAYQAEEAHTAQTRARMSNLRTALIEFEGNEDRYPGSLDSLIQYVRTDSAYQGLDLDSLFAEPGAARVSVDSMPFSPRSGRRFEYAVNDTGEVDIYYLADPDRPEDYIGAREPDPTRRNAASWE